MKLSKHFQKLEEDCDIFLILKKLQNCERKIIVRARFKNRQKLNQHFKLLQNKLLHLHIKLNTYKKKTIFMSHKQYL